MPKRRLAVGDGAAVVVVVDPKENAFFVVEGAAGAPIANGATGVCETAAGWPNEKLEPATVVTVGCCANENGDGAAACEVCGAGWPNENAPGAALALGVNPKLRAVVPGVGAVCPNEKAGVLVTVAPNGGGALDACDMRPNDGAVDAPKEGAEDVGAPNAGGDVTPNPNGC